MAEFIGGYIWRVVTTFRVLDVAGANVWYYGNAGSAGSALDVLHSWNDDILTSLTPIQTEGLMWETIDVQGVRGIFDLEHQGIDVAGLITDDPEPTFVAFSYRFNRAAGNERHGYKRIGGVPDNAWVDGEIPGAVRTALDAVAPDLAAPINASGTSYVPLIQRRFEDNVELDEPKFYTFNTATFINISTQNSRKRL